MCKTHIIAVIFVVLVSGCRWRDESLNQQPIVSADAAIGGNGGSGGETPDASTGGDEPDAAVGGHPHPGGHDDAAVGGTGGETPDASPTDAGMGGIEPDAATPECFAALDCGDGNACTRDVCLGGTCSHEYSTTACDDQDHMTTDVCAPSAEPNQPTCFNLPSNPPAGCTPQLDEDACTQDLCDVDGNTVHPPKDCGDGDPSTSDVCIPSGECTHESLCGEGTAYDPNQGKCVPFFAETCIEDSFSCEQIAGEVVYAQCHADRWLQVNDCGPIGDGVCVDGRGCSSPNP